RHLQVSAGKARYLLVNTGNANAGTGEKGLQDALSCCEVLANISGVAVESILPFSTGVIGEHLPVERIALGIPKAVAALDANSWPDAARGIMTTDTRPKSTSTVLETAQGPVTLTGIAKGA